MCKSRYDPRRREMTTKDPGLLVNESRRGWWYLDLTPNGLKYGSVAYRFGICSFVETNVSTAIG